MKKVLSFILGLVFIVSMFVGCSSTKENKEAKEVTKNVLSDMAGRKIELPKKIEKVYSATPVGTTLLYTLAPEKLAGLNFKLTEAEKKYTTENYSKLPVLGGWFGKDNSGNAEEIMKGKPDIAIYMGDLDSTTISKVDKIQSQLGIPVVMLDGDLKNTAKTYEFIGNLLGEKEKAKELGNYFTKTLDDVNKALKNVPEDKRVKVYYAEGLKGLDTDPKGSVHSEVLELAGGVNIADVEMKKGYGRVSVSIEQILKWNPAMIIIDDAAAKKDVKSSYDTITSDQSWSSIKAVKDKKVYKIPSAPFSWFDRPTSVNRIIGIKWLSNLLYPDYVKLDIKNEVKDFYKKFYHRDLTDTEIQEIMEKSF